MIVREAKDLSLTDIGTSGLQGKALVPSSDHAPYICYEIMLEEGKYQLKAFDKGYNHVYYCIYGKGTVSMGTFNDTLTIDSGFTIFFFFNLFFLNHLH